MQLRLTRGAVAAAFCSAAAAAAARPLAAQDAAGHAHVAPSAAPNASPAARAARAPRLGRVAFATSAAPAAREPFARGLLWLHSFEYAHAAEAFREAQRRDPGDVMSYWGEAMSYTHPLWGQQDAPAARAALARLAPTRAARLARARTPRERAYLDAVETLYDSALAPDGTPDGPRARRDTAYLAAMTRLSAAYPADDDARLFTALATMGAAIATRDSASYARAADLSEDVFRRRPDNPGASHYLIHAVDDPAHARRGLAAARAYTDLAPDAGHAQHMTSHIFIALGMWDGVVAANERALATIPQPDPAAVRVDPHDVYWLEYGLLQQGRLAEARRWRDAMRAQAARDSVGMNRPAAAVMAAAYTIDAHPDSAAAALAPLVAPRPAGRPARGRDLVLEELAGALALRAAGQRDSALALARAAAALDESIPFMYGPPPSVLPPRELAGALLLELGRPAEARAEYARALERTPGRARALLGLARACQAAGDSAAAARAYGELARTWRRADADVPGLAEVRARAEPNAGAGAGAR